MHGRVLRARRPEIKRLRPKQRGNVRVPSLLTALDPKSEGLPALLIFHVHMHGHETYHSYPEAAQTSRNVDFSDNLQQTGSAS